MDCRTLRYASITAAVALVVGLLIGAAFWAPPERAAAIGSVGASLILAGITAWYAWHAREMARITTKEHEIRVRPLVEVHGSARKFDSGEATVEFRIIITNKGQYHIRITGGEFSWWLRGYSKAPPTSTIADQSTWIEPNDQQQIYKTLTLQKELVSGFTDIHRELIVRGEIHFLNEATRQIHTEPFHHP